jgi:hypothetical protein
MRLCSGRSVGLKHRDFASDFNIRLPLLPHLRSISRSAQSSQLGLCVCYLSSPIICYQSPTSLINENSYHVLLLNLYLEAHTAKRSYILQRKLTSYSTVCGGTQRSTPSRIRPTRVVVATLLHRSLHRAACSQPMVTRVQRAPFSLYPILLSTGLERLTPWSSTLLKNMIPIYSERRSRNIASSSSTQIACVKAPQELWYGYRLPRKYDSDSCKVVKCIAQLPSRTKLINAVMRPVMMCNNAHCSPVSLVPIRVSVAAF